MRVESIGSHWVGMQMWPYLLVMRVRFELGS